MLYNNIEFVTGGYKKHCRGGGGGGGGGNRTDQNFVQCLHKIRGKEKKRKNRVFPIIATIDTNGAQYEGAIISQVSYNKKINTHLIKKIATTSTFKRKKMYS